MAEGSAAFKQEEIAQLERQLQEKRAALGQDLESNDAGLPNRELVHDVVKERIQEHVPDYHPSSVPKVAPSAQSNGHQPSYLLPEFKDLVQGFINIVFNKSIAEAILIQTSLAILREEGYKNLFVEINSVGDKESLARFTTPLKP